MEEGCTEDSCIHPTFPLHTAKLWRAAAGEKREQLPLQMRAPGLPNTLDPT